jgi:hypothetical protein
MKAKYLLYQLHLLTTKYKLREYLLAGILRCIPTNASLVHEKDW